MVDLQLIILYVFAFISLVPVIEINAVRHRSHFKELKSFMMLVFAWSLLMVLKYSLTNLVLIYFLHIMSYTLVFAIAIYLIRTVYEFYGKTIPFNVRVISYSILLIHLIFMLSNTWTQWFINVTPVSIESLESITSAEIGPFMFVHIILAYGLLFYGIGYMIYGFMLRPYKKNYRTPVIITIGLIFVIFPVNLWHVISGSMYVDPTYLSAVIFSLVLYYIVYKGNFIVSLSAEGRKTILSKMREYYILCTEDGKIIEISPALLKNFNLKLTKNITPFMDSLKAHAVLYKDIDRVKNKSIAKPYLFTIQKTFSINRFNVKGVLHLFYDETKFVKLINELETMQNRDYMTGLLNRNYLEVIIDDLEEHYHNFGVILTDLNGLKLLNDSFGHKRGDQQILAYRDVLLNFQKFYPTVDVIRSGGDEFTLIVKDASHDSLQAMDDNIHDLCDKSDSISSMAISSGFALRKGSESFDTVNQKADRELYKMKDKKSEKYKQYLIETYNIKAHKS